MATDSDLPRSGFVARSCERCAEIESESATKGKGADMASRGKTDSDAAAAAEVYFTAGPDHGSGGLFGYLTAVSTELTEGNDQ